MKEKNTYGIATYRREQWGKLQEYAVDDLTDETYEE